MQTKNSQFQTKNPHFIDISNETKAPSNILRAYPPKIQDSDHAPSKDKGLYFKKLTKQAVP
ncbi:hypothetical protein [Bartonella mastomydis]|uniref:hypothetical protein n=1 Tax=Bartonella mastomydis TaxID=1820002 RepID=UPI0011176C3B|nr:hypothetical protein [Bartonella mastomydis]